MGVLLGAALAAAQTSLPLHAAWDPPRTEDYHPLSPVFLGEDRAVDTAIWHDNETTWVYVLGEMTNANGAKIFGIYRYDIDDPDTNNTNWYPPTAHLTTTVNHRPAALAIDPDTGAVYCTGSIYDGAERDYLTVRFLADLSGLDLDWSGDGIETFNGSADGADFAVDIAVAAGSGLKRVIVTGTSTTDGGEDPDHTDIYTIAYYTDAGQLPASGWIHWEDALNNEAENGNETATELVTWAITESESPGAVAAVAGTSDNGANGLDMIVTIYLPPEAGTTPVRAWAGTQTDGVRLYNGPADGDDVCMGLAASPDNGQSAFATLSLCGRTPKHPVYTGDTEYLVWALKSVDGDDFWESGTYFGGRAWSPAETEEGADCAYDIVYGPIENQEVWVTGECLFDGTWDVGTLAFDLSDDAGNLKHESIFDSPVADGRDDRGRAITVGPLGGAVFVTGWTEGYSDPSVLTLQYAQSDGQVDAVGRRFNDYHARGVALFFTAITDPPALIVTGASVADVIDGLCWITMRYEP